MTVLMDRFLKKFLEDDWYKPIDGVEKSFKENDDHYLLKIALPGASKESMEVEVDNDVLTIKGSTFNRDVKLAYIIPTNVDADAIHSRLNDGILEIDMPKVKDNSRKIEIN